MYFKNMDFKTLVFSVTFLKHTTTLYKVELMLIFTYFFCLFCVRACVNVNFPPLVFLTEIRSGTELRHSRILESYHHICLSVSEA